MEPFEEQRKRKSSVWWNRELWRKELDQSRKSIEGKSGLSSYGTHIDSDDPKIDIPISKNLSPSQ